MLGVIIYSWYNRESDRVVLTLVTAMLLGSIGFITKESISNKVEKVSQEFPVVVFFELPNYMPMNIRLPYHYELSMCIQGINPNDLPDSKEYINLEYASKTYYDAIEFLIVKEIFDRFNYGWNVKAKQTVLPSGKSISWKILGDTGDKISINKIMEAIPENYFYKLCLPATIHELAGGEAIFPPGTTFDIKRDDDVLGTSIHFKNKFIDIELKLTQDSSVLGIGEYTRLLGYSDDKSRVNGTASYFLSVEITQSVWLNGHPDMVTYRNWADSILELLDNNFNYEKIREEHIRQFQLYGSNAIHEM